MGKKTITSTLIVMLLATVTASAQDAPGDESAAEIPADSETNVTESEPEGPRADGIEAPKAMSGMSILGNEEAPKALVIIPWKSSEMGDTLSLSDSLDDRARPVDKEVFLRELAFYQIRSTEQ